MQPVFTAIKRLAITNDGQDLLEYGFLGALIAVVAVAGVTTVGKTIYEVFWKVIPSAI
jgi:Flp pilus assembly pilin Flp